MSAVTSGVNLYTAPVSNADVGRTVAAILQLDFKDKGSHTGRVITEAMRGGVMPDVRGSGDLD